MLLFLCTLLAVTPVLAEDGISGVWQGMDEKTGAILRLTLKEDGTFEGFSTDRPEVYTGSFEANDGLCTLKARDSGPGFQVHAVGRFTDPIDKHRKGIHIPKAGRPSA